MFLNRAFRLAVSLLAISATLAAPAAAADPPVTVDHAIGATFVAAACGPVHSETFAVPEDAVVVNATLRASLDVLNTTALSATVDVRAGTFVVASNSTTGGLGLLGAGGSLDVRLLNAALLNQTAANGSIALDLVVSVCPTLGVAAVTLEAASLTYVRAGAPPVGNGTSVAPIVGLSIGTEVAAGESVNASVVLNGTASASTQYAWFVDGALVATGPALSNYRFSEGPHNVTVRASDGANVTSYSVRVNAVARPAPSPFLGPLALAAAVGAAVVGIAVAGTDRGRYFFFASSVGSVFSRLKKASLLDHFVRGALYQIIRENPGIHFAELRRRAELANGAAAHHLRMLERGGYLRVVVDGTKTKFYLTDRPLEAEVYGISDTERAILTAVAETPGLAQSDLVDRLGKSASAVSRSVTRLVSLGYVTTRHEGPRVLVFPREGADTLNPLTPAWPDEGA